MRRSAGSSRFFAEVASAPILRAVYTDEDLGPPRTACACFSLRAIRVALDDAGPGKPHREQLWRYLESTANHMINRRE